MESTNAKEANLPIRRNASLVVKLKPIFKKWELKMDQIETERCSIAEKHL